MNPFALFDLEPFPALDADELKQKFTHITSASHPDKFNAGLDREAAESNYAILNQAYQTLMDPRQRLLNLYQLERGEKPPDVQRIPPGTMDLFMEVGQTCQNLDTYLERKRKASSVLAKAALLNEELGLQEMLLFLRGKLENFAGMLEKDLSILDHKWRGGEKAVTELEILYRKYSYLARWRQQLEEREIALLTE